MPDPLFAAPRLAEIYDVLEGERDDLDHYLAVAAELGARSVLDVGCGTGTFACLLADRGIEVVGVEWTATLRGIYAALRPGGHLVFEVRDPARKAWLGWNREATYVSREIPGVGGVETWYDATKVNGEYVSYRRTYVFAVDGTTLTSDSTRRFRSRTEIDGSLRSGGYTLVNVRDAPDRPGRELVFIARKMA